MFCPECAAPTARDAVRCATCDAPISALYWDRDVTLGTCPGDGASGVDARAEAARAETPKTETPNADTPNSDTPKTDTPKTETPNTETPSADPLVGLLLEGRFRVLAPLRSGGMGDVYTGLDVRLQRDVAIKWLSRRYADDAGARGRFAREARALGRLCHPGVVVVLSVGEHDGRPYFVMPCVKARRCRRVWRRAVTPVTRARAWTPRVRGPRLRTTGV